MKIRVEKKNSDKYILYFADSSEIRGMYLSTSDLKKLLSNLKELTDYNLDKAGDDF
jgi:hypothetical protein